MEDEARHRENHPRQQQEVEHQKLKPNYLEDETLAKMTKLTQLIQRTPIRCILRQLVHQQVLPHKEAGLPTVYSEKREIQVKLRRWLEQE